MKNKAPKLSITRINCIIVMLSVVLCCFVSGCGKKEGYVTKQFFAMDTWMEIQLPESCDDKDLELYFNDVEAIVRKFEACFSVTSTASDLYKLNNDINENVTLDSKELLDILKEGEYLEDLTDGAFCDKLYVISKEWGFTTGNYKVPDKAWLDAEILEIQDIMDDSNTDISVDINESSVIRPVGTCFDLGGIAKGYATDKIVDYLADKGINSAIVNLGGNIYAFGDKQGKEDRFVVGITDPFDNTLLGTVMVKDMAVVTSGNYERYFELDGERYHHIIDSTTGYPADNGLVSVTIISEDASYADGLSTALFVMGLDEAITFWENNRNSFDAILITENNEIYYTEGLLDNFVMTEKPYTCKLVK